MLPNNQTAANLYEQLKTKREPFLKKARDCSALTIPSLIPKEGISPGADFDSTYQSVGARGVTNLAAKLLLALLPPNTPFFKLAVDVYEMKKIEKDQNLKSSLEAALSEVEQAVMVEVETSATRVTSFEALQHLVVGGNALIEVPDKDNLKVYHLNRYVVQRDPMGNVKLIIIREDVAPDTLDPQVKRALGKEGKEKTCTIYTVCQRSAKRWNVWQETKEGLIEGTDGFYPADKCPYIPLRFTKVDGEDYGRGFVEQYLGDLNSLEALDGAIVQGSIAAAKILFLVLPSGLTSAKKLAEANNGDFVAGRKDDVHCLQLDKYADLQVAATKAEKIEKRLAEAFLLMSSVRNAERVTAEEIRALVQELESSLGGVYSVQAQDFQLPLSNALMARMAKDGRLPALPKKIVRPTVTTGVEALGRGQDLQKLQSFLANAQQAFGPQVLAQYVNPGEYFKRSATALAISTKGLVRTDEEVQAQTQQAQQAAAMQSATEKLGPEVIRQAGAARAAAAA